MEQLDRMSMLKKLTFIGERNINIFSSYIPDHYDEIYTLYDLLKKASIDYNNIEFSKPIAKDSSFIFICELADKDYKKIDKFLTNIDCKFKCMRNKPFSISISKSKNNNTHINFKKI